VRLPLVFSGRSLRAAPPWVPSGRLNPLTVAACNEMWFRKAPRHREGHIEPSSSFFHPRDGVRDWNRMYGPRGFLQHQFVVPFEDGFDAMREILNRIRRSGEGSFLTVLKKFGDIQSPGMLSFPRPGITLALDFAYDGKKTLQLLDDLDKIVRESRGAVYPAKDARMSAESFQAFFPRWREFAKYVDPHFSSSFWRRVAGAEALPSVILSVSKGSEMFR